MSKKLHMPNVGSSCAQNSNISDLRRSKRRKPSNRGPILYGKKSQHISRLRKRSNVTCLTNLPNLVLSKLLQFLDVKSLENLSATCSLFDQLIAGQYITSISIPFSPEFVEEMKTSKSIDRKPLLKLEVGKSKSICLQVMLRRETGSPSILEYLIDSQLSLLDLSKLREIDLVFNTPLELTVQDMDNIFRFYRTIFLLPMFNIYSISAHNLINYKNITRLHMMTDEESIAVGAMLPWLTNLIELGLHVHTRKNLGSRSFQLLYVSRLQAVVEASRAHILKLTFLSETIKQIEKKLTSNVVERLEIEGPCTVNIVPVMKNLKEVIVKPKPEASINSTGEVCTYWKSRSADRAIHRAGLCCVNLGSTYANCPKLARFMGVDVSSLNDSHTSGIKNLKLKKKFYKLYVTAGGSQDFKTWCKMRWICKKVERTNSLPL